VALTRDDVLRVAELARLTLTAEEASRLESDLTHILDAFETLDALDTGAAPPMRPLDDCLGDLRPDAAQNPSASDTLLAGAPDRHGRLFHVPKIIE